MDSGNSENGLIVGFFLQCLRESDDAKVTTHSLSLENNLDLLLLIIRSVSGQGRVGRMQEVNASASLNTVVFTQLLRVVSVP